MSVTHIATETSNKEKTRCKKWQPAFGTGKRTRFGTLNICTMTESTKLEQAVKVLREYKLEVLGLSEIRLKGIGERQTLTGETLIFSGKPEDADHRSGVGFLLSKTAKQCLKYWKPISDRIIVARFKTRTKNITFIQAYAPINKAPVERKDEFYQLLSRTMEEVNRSDVLIVMGDLNAKVGSNNTGREIIMGKHGVGKMNENGELFADFCLNYDLVIGGTQFSHKIVHKLTWFSNDDKTINQIDHITVNRRNRNSLLDVRVCRGADVDTDHYLLVGTIRIKLKTVAKKFEKTNRKYNIAKLNERAHAECFEQNLAEKLQNRPILDTDSAEEMWGSVVTILQEVCENVLGNVNSTRKDWMSEDTWRLIHERKEVHIALLNASGAERRRLKKLYSDLRKKISRAGRRDQRCFIANLATKAEEAAYRNNARELYRLQKELSNCKVTTEKPVRAEDGSLITGETEQIERWTDYFEALLNRPTNEGVHSPVHNRSLSRFDENPPSKTEIKDAINKLKNGKAPGAENIAAEILKVNSDRLAEILVPVLNIVWSTGSIPNSWLEAMIVKLPKKGDLTKCSNWRGISVLSSINKLIAILLYTRIADKLEPHIRRQQAGFRPQRSCVDHINTLRIIAEQTKEWRTPLYMLFVDFKQAFDSLDRSMMWKILESRGIPTTILRLIQELYRGASCKVLHRGKLGLPFQVRSGVKQGCILSPLLFLIVLDWVMDKVDATPKGIQWILNSKLGDLCFADDICLLTHNKEDMEYKLSQLIKYAGQVGLKINVGKTKLLRIGTKIPCKFVIEGEEIEEVKSFQYLGSVFTADGGADEDVENRLLKAKQAFAALRNIWRANQISRNVKLKFFRTNVLSVLLYGCETWKVTNKIVGKIQVFVNKSLRQILKIFWPQTISNEKLWQITNFEEMVVYIRRKKWKWIGHTLRKGNDDLAKQALDWNPQGSRRPGRPAETWGRTVRREAKDSGKTWIGVKGLAQNKVRWRLFVDALCSPAEL